MVLLTHLKDGMFVLPERDRKRDRSFALRSLPEGMARAKATERVKDRAHARERGGKKGESVKIIFIYKHNKNCVDTGKQGMPLKNTIVKSICLT